MCNRRAPGRGERGRGERGSAVVDLVLMVAFLVPVVLGVMQLALVLYVRNVAETAASQGARYGAMAGMTHVQGVARARQVAGEASSGRFVTAVTGGTVTVGGAPVVTVDVAVRVPALGLGGPAVALTAHGRAVHE